MAMHQNLYVLQIYGTNIKISAAAEPAFVGFVDGMAVKLDVGRRLLDELLEQIKRLSDGVASVDQAGRLLAKEFAPVVPHVPTKLAADAEALDGYLQSLSAVARQVAEIARAVQAQVGIALGTLQVGDSTRQRLEHVVAGLQMLDTAVDEAGGRDNVDPAAMGIVRRLLAAQLTAAASAFDQGAERLVASLRGLAPEAARLLALIEQDGNGEGRAFLARLEQGMGDVAPVVDRLSNAGERSRAMMELMSATVGELVGRIREIGRVQIDVQDIATNTRLLCRRHGATGKAVSVIAAEIDVQANMLKAAMNDVVRPIEILDAVSDETENDPSGGNGDIGSMLSAALRIVQEGCLRTERAIGVGGDDANQLIALLDGSATDISVELALGQSIREAAANLSTAPDSDTPDEQGTVLLQSVLGRIFAIYTMASEREVHADALPPAFAPPPAAAVVEEDEDDGLF